MVIALRTPLKKPQIQWRKRKVQERARICLWTTAPKDPHSCWTLRPLASFPFMKLWPIFWLVQASPYHGRGRGSSSSDFLCFQKCAWPPGSHAGPQWKRAQWRGLGQACPDPMPGSSCKIRSGQRLSALVSRKAVRSWKPPRRFLCHYHYSLLTAMGSPGPGNRFSELLGPWGWGWRGMVVLGGKAALDGWWHPGQGRLPLISLGIPLPISSLQGG